MIKLIGEGKYHLITNYIGNWCLKIPLSKNQLIFRYFDSLRNSNESHFVKLREATRNNPVVRSLPKYKPGILRLSIPPSLGGGRQR